MTAGWILRSAVIFSHFIPHDKGHVSENVWKLNVTYLLSYCLLLCKATKFPCLVYLTVQSNTMTVFTVQSKSAIIVNMYNRSLITLQSLYQRRRGNMSSIKVAFIQQF